MEGNFRSFTIIPERAFFISSLSLELHHFFMFYLPEEVSEALKKIKSTRDTVSKISGLGFLPFKSHYVG